MYYFYIIASAVGSIFITFSKKSVHDLRDFWKPLLLMLLLFLCCVLLHASVSMTASMFASRKKDWKNIHNIFRFISLKTMSLFLHIMRAKIHISGTEKLPEKERFLLVGNHLSIFDPIVAMYCLRDKSLAFVAKKEVIRLPFFGRLMLACGCVSLDRENNRSAIKSIDQATRKMLDNTASMGIYPEGKINKTGESLLPFHYGSFRIASRSGCPIVIAAIRNTEKLRKRFLYASTDVYFDIIDVISPEQIAKMKTSDISSMAWSIMHEHLERVSQKL